MASVTLKDIRKNFGQTDVIKGIDLEIKHGEFMVFVGPSGCGKTTTLRMIAGLEDISGGDLSIDGVRANDLHPSMRGAAMVFQSYALYPHMSVAENMAFSLKMSGVPKAQQIKQVQDAAEILDLTALLNRLPKDLSGGQRQRVALGRAIVRNPKVFLFDEPLSNLDAALRVHMRMELSRLHKKLGTTMIYVTHDQAEAMTMSDRIAIFNKGRIEQVGPPMELYNKPCNEFVASFLGTPSINFFDKPQGASITPSMQQLWDSIARQMQPQVQRIGVRPEHISIAQPDQNGILGHLAFMEHLGDISILYIKIDGLPQLMSAKLSNAQALYEQGQAVKILLNSRYAIGFDSSSNTVP